MLSCIQAKAGTDSARRSWVSGFFSSNCVLSFGSKSCGRKVTFRTATMTTRTLLLQCTAYMSIGVLLGCAQGLHPLAAQSSSRDDGTNSITSPPSEQPQGNGSIDYKSAKPLPFPSVPGPIPPDILPAPPLPPRDRDPRGAFQAISGLGSNTPKS
jgi:hypothetical protein